MEQRFGNQNMWAETINEPWVDICWFFLVFLNIPMSCNAQKLMEADSIMSFKNKLQEY